MKRDLEEFIQHYLNKLGSSRESEQAFHSLIEAPDSVVPVLKSAFFKVADPEKKEIILEIVAHFRLPESVGFFSRVFKEAKDELWKGAVDGLVSIGNVEAHDFLQTALETNEWPERREWIEEAIEQIQKSES